MLSKEVSSTTFWVFDMTRPEIEPQSSLGHWRTLYHWSWGSLSYNISWAEIAWQSTSLSRSKTSLDSEFFFSLTCCHTRVKEFSLPYTLLVAGRRELLNSLLYQVYWYANMKCKQLHTVAEFTFFNNNHYLCHKHIILLNMKKVRILLLNTFWLYFIMYDFVLCLWV